MHVSRQADAQGHCPLYLLASPSKAPATPQDFIFFVLSVSFLLAGIRSPSHTQALSFSPDDRRRRSPSSLCLVTSHRGLSTDRQFSTISIYVLGPVSVFHSINLSLSVFRVELSPLVTVIGGKVTKQSRHKERTKTYCFLVASSPPSVSIPFFLFPFSVS